MPHRIRAAIRFAAWLTPAGNCALLMFAYGWLAPLNLDYIKWIILMLILTFTFGVGIFDGFFVPWVSKRDHKPELRPLLLHAGFFLVAQLLFVPALAACLFVILITIT